MLWAEKEAQQSLAAEARADRDMELLQRYAVEWGVDPVFVFEEALARLVPAKLEPAPSVGATRSKGSKKSR